MSEPKMDFPEVVGKLVAELSILHDLEFGKEVLLRFADGTSISIGVRQVVDARFCNEETPDILISHRQTG
jgi:hypothetical protein